MYALFVKALSSDASPARDSFKASQLIQLDNTDLYSDLAIVEAESTGKTTALCDPNGNFLSYYNKCVNCVQGNGNSGTSEDYPNPKLGQHLDYCGIRSISLTVTVQATCDNVEYGLSPAAVSSPSSEDPATSTLSAVTPAQSSGSTTLVPQESESHGKAWIAGPIVGSIGGVAVLFIAGLLLRKRRQRTKSRTVSGDAFDKPQLHSDHIPRLQVAELEVNKKQDPIEMPAEVVPIEFTVPPYEMGDENQRLNQYLTAGDVPEQP
ncbi:hypothetical protein BKA67DRAFT_535001 [Truncatella angustata]|uniref:Uncharacterized protein n=1 Tax=Truncatella angustata TaxID=152316 RepID=A0A9P8UQ20_9PEZI|nr:uncharacterized protein BKA67DRAFT_535001 [Truncatella angustata]KAH6656105.1 hypothetical protein BKA67DRAFT_535001 [Truncatella angustata]